MKEQIIANKIRLSARQNDLYNMREDGKTSCSGKPIPYEYVEVAIL